MNENKKYRVMEIEIPGFLFYCEPKADACNHDWGGWRDFATGGERFCTKCGMGAVHHSLTHEEVDRATGFDSEHSIHSPSEDSENE